MLLHSCAPGLAPPAPHGPMSYEPLLRATSDAYNHDLDQLVAGAGAADHKVPFHPTVAAEPVTQLAAACPQRAVLGMATTGYRRASKQQDSLDFDLVRQEFYLPPSSPMFTKKRKMADTEHGPEQRRRSDDFIGFRVHHPTDEVWTQVAPDLDESPFLPIRPTTEQMLESHLRDAQPLPRDLQVFQKLMRWGLGRRVDGVDLSFLREQDRAFADLQAELSGRPAKTTGTGTAAAAATAAGGASSSSFKQQAGDGVNHHKTDSTSDSSNGTQQQQQQQQQKKKRGRAGTGVAGEVTIKIPKVEVSGNGEILVDGEKVQAGGALYARVFGLAYDEKARDPAWKIGNGMVDRCYYKGSKKDAKARPGDYFPTDQSMFVDFVKRRPDAFIEEEA